MHQRRSNPARTTCTATAGRRGKNLPDSEALMGCAAFGHATIPTTKSSKFSHFRTQGNSLASCTVRLPHNGTSGGNSISHPLLQPDVRIDLDDDNEPRNKRKARKNLRVSCFVCFVTFVVCSFGTPSTFAYRPKAPAVSIAGSDWSRAQDHAPMYQHTIMRLITEGVLS